MASVHSLGGPGAHAEKGKAFGRRRAPPCGDTATDQEWGEGRPGQLWAPSTIDPGQSDGGFHLQGLLPQSALQVLRDKVGLVMLGEVVTPHEALLTLGTLKALVTWEEERTVSKEPTYRHRHSPTRRSTRESPWKSHRAISAYPTHRARLSTDPTSLPQPSLLT